MFAMRLRLRDASITSYSGEEGQFEIVEEDDDIRSVLAAICDSLEDSGQAEFQVEGFGLEPWPVDVRTDLLTVLEQIPELLEFLKTSGCNEVSMDFFEQGMERALTFNKSGGIVKIGCLSRTAWTPDPSHEIIGLPDLNLMLCELLEVFVAIATQFYPAWTGHRYFQTWRDETYLRFCLHRK